VIHFPSIYALTLTYDLKKFHMPNQYEGYFLEVTAELILINNFDWGNIWVVLSPVSLSIWGKWGNIDFG
jgi:hypothetical protein